MKKTNDHKTIKENDCDLLALTFNGDVVGYTDSDSELKEWLDNNIDDDYSDNERSLYQIEDYEHKYDWFCVETDD